MSQKKPDLCEVCQTPIDDDGFCPNCENEELELDDDFEIDEDDDF